MEEVLTELTALHVKLNGAVSLLRVVSAAADAKLGRIGYADALWALWQHLSNVSADMEEALGRAVIALNET